MKVRSIKSIDDAFFRENVIRQIKKQEVYQNKVEKLNDKRKKIAYILSLYKKTGEEEYLNVAYSLRVNNKKNPELCSEKPKECLEKDIEINKEEVEKTEEKIPFYLTGLAELIEEETSRGISGYITETLRKIGKSSLFDGIYIKDDPFDNDTFRDSILSENNIQ